MPTFTAIALERLLEPSVGDSAPNNSLPSKLETNKSEATVKKSPHIYISPALYATPNPTPVPKSSPTSLSPSPYVVNRKRREVRAPENRLDGFQVNEKSKEEGVPDEAARGDGSEGSMNQMGEACVDFPSLEEEERDDTLLDVEIFEGNDQGLVKEGAPEMDEGSLDEFVNPCDSMSVASSCENNDQGSLRRSVWKHAPLSIQSEFYDTSEEFFSDSCTSLPSPSFSPNVEAELRAIRLNLFEEIERRKKAEEALGHMHSQWRRISNNLSQVGLSFPVTSEAGNMLLEIDTEEQFYQEIVIARFVSEAVGRGHVRAETEAVAEAVIESKNQEIARLQDKLQYHEAVNHEMSQRNQEVIEMSRRQRRSRQRRKKWIWSCIGLSAALGASVLACSYLPNLGKELLPTSNDGSHTSSSMPTSIEVHP